MNLQNIKAAVLKHKIASISLAVAVVLGAVLFLRHATLSSTQAELESEREQSQRLAANVSNAALLEDHLRAIQEAQKAVGERLISPSDLAINQQYFYKIEAETGVKFLDLRQNISAPAKGQKATGSFVPVNFSVSLRGSFSNAMTFLRRLENGPAFCRIVSASASPAAADEKSKGTDVILNLTVELLGRP